MLIETEGRQVNFYCNGRLFMNDKQSSNAEAIKREAYWKKAVQDDNPTMENKN